MEIIKTTDGLFYKNEIMEENLRDLPKYKVARIAKKLIDTCGLDTLLSVIDIIIENHGQEKQ